MIKEKFIMTVSTNNLTNNFEKGILCKSLIPLVFLISLSYWIYLAFASSMIIRHDSLEYEYLGSLLHNQGWVEYFKTGPNREPLYPLIVSFSMTISEWLSYPYQKILTIIQVLILLLTQILTFILLKKARVNNYIIAAILLYLGLSPAIVNSGFSLYSEIATYPWILGIILFSIRSSKVIQEGKYFKIILTSILFGLCCVMITFVKGIFEFIIPIMIISLTFVLIKSFWKNKKLILNSCLCILTVLIVFYSSILGYKFLNKIHNGFFALTNRGTWALYASAARRVEKLTPERFLTAVAYIPGQGFCNAVFGGEACHFWGIEKLDSLGYAKLHEVIKEVPKNKIDDRLMSLTKEKILENPIQFTFLIGIDWLKMFFCESTKMGFVSYPNWLTKLFNFTPFKNGLRLVVSCLSLFAFLFLVVIVFKNRSVLFSIDTKKGQHIQTYFFTLLIIFLHVSLYSLFDTIPRFALPIAPLYLLTIGFSVDWIIYKKTVKK